MSEARLHISVTSPTRPTQEFEASEAVLPGAGGVFSVLPGHTPLITTLGQGALILYSEESEPQFFALHDGFAEVLNNRISILADVMEPAEEIDLARAKQAEERARDQLRKHDADINLAHVEAALARSLARQQAHGRQPY